MRQRYKRTAPPSAPCKVYPNAREARVSEWEQSYHVLAGVTSTGRRLDPRVQSNRQGLPPFSGPAQGQPRSVRPAPPFATTELRSAAYWVQSYRKTAPRAPFLILPLRSRQ